jgi:hypothetical protein|tara:strand:- start:6 stop:185 length:180 start_codon:yes stop_codon:yes gene_type:complete
MINGKVQKIDAVLSLKSDAVVSFKADGTLEWLDGNPTNITDEQITAEQQRLQAIEDSKE